MYKKEFDTSYVGFMKDGAKWLVENTDIKLVGKMQYPFVLLKSPSLFGVPVLAKAFYMNCMGC